MDDMDHYELMAINLEDAQQNRFRQWNNSDTTEDFWTEREVRIHKVILRYRSNSETYHPRNLR